MNAVNIVGSFLGGCIGAMVGGNPAFIIVGIIGVVFLAMGNAPDASLLQSTIEYTLFTPCICFSGNVAALAYAANIRKYEGINGTDLNKALGFTQDFSVLMVGGVFGILGFLNLNLVMYLKLPLDAGAFTVVILGILVRLLFGHAKFINPKLKEVSLFNKGDGKEWAYKIMAGFVVACVASYAASISGKATIGFYFSALSLIFLLLDGDFPVTHHVSIIAGYASVRSGNVLIGILFGVLASIVFELYQNTINSNVDSHIDAPACTIATFSLIIFCMYPA